MRRIRGPVAGMLGLGVLGIVALAVQKVLSGGPRHTKRPAVLRQLSSILSRYISRAKINDLLTRVSALPAEERSPAAVALIAQQVMTPEELARVEADPELRALIAEAIR